MKSIKLFALLTALLFVYSVKAQTVKPDTATRSFIIKASIAGLMEVTDGKLAEEKAQNSQVKAFGKQMVTDHTKAQNQLMQLAKSGGYQIPAQATSGIVPDVMLTRANGSQFDQMYVHMMVPGHQKTILLFQTYAVNGKDPNVKAFAQQTLPVLKQHLATITAIEKQMKNQAVK